MQRFPKTFSPKNCQQFFKAKKAKQGEELRKIIYEKFFLSERTTNEFEVSSYHQSVLQDIVTELKNLGWMTQLEDLHPLRSEITRTLIVSNPFLDEKSDARINIEEKT